MNYDLQKIVSLTTRNNTKLAPLASAYVKSFAEGIGMSDEKSESIAFLTREALERRMLNAYKGVGEITLDILVGLDRIQIEIADRGIPYWLDVRSERSNHKVRPDEFSLKKMGTDGQRFCMAFYLEPDVDILASKKQDDVQEELLDGAVHVHRVHSDEKEITEIMRCIYYNFGFDYPNCRIYETPHLSRLLETGKQWSYLATNDHGQALGHVSLAFHDEFPGMPEIGALVSRPFCRGRNVAGHMVERLCSDAEKAGVPGAYAVPVAFHPFSQKVFSRQNFIPVGMILHYLPSKNAWDYAEGDRRMDMFVCAKMFSNPGRKTVYIPEKHREFISGIYENLNIECECRVSAPSGTAAGNSRYTVSQDQNLKMAEFVIDHISDDFEKDLEQTMEDFRQNGMELVKIYLNISDPCAVSAFEILEKNGFFFSGILPGCETGEYMMMSHLMGLPMKWDRITPDGENQMVLDYIQKNICENN